MARAAPDLRTVALASFGWCGALVGSGQGWVLPVVGGLGLGLTVAVLLRRHRRGLAAAVLAGLLVYAAAAGAAFVRQERVTHNPLTRLAHQRVQVTLTGTVAEDPRLVVGRFGDEVFVRLHVHSVLSGGSELSLREPVLVIARRPWLDAPLGATVHVTGHLEPSFGGDVAALITTSESPDIRAGPAWWWQMSSRVREGLRDSVRSQPPERRALVLVDPPFEAQDEFAQAASALGEGLARMRSGVFALWYPLTERARVDEFFFAVRALEPPPTLAAELMIAGETAPMKMKGCGLLVVNPPWQFDGDAQATLAFLATTLAQAPGGGGRVDWIVRES